MISALLATLALAAAPDPHALAKKVQAFYDKTGDFTADFSQTYTYTAFHRTQKSSGKLAVKKPGMLRWDYAAPSKKTIAAKDHRLVQYEPESNQAYVDEHFDAQSLGAGVTFLWGKGSLEKEFALATNDKGELVMTPKEPDPRLREIALDVAESGEVKGTRVTDGSGNVNELRFTNVKVNAGLKDAFFELKLPPGVRRLAAPQQQ